jgi:ketosteroid isomerase-like protein
MEVSHVAAMRMSRTVLAVLFVSLAACHPAPAATTPNAAPPTPVEVDAAVKSRIEQYRQGYEVRSLDALAPLYSKTDDLSITVQGRTQRGWAKAQEWLGAWLEKATTVKVRVTEVQVIALGDAGALATMNVHRTYGDGVTTVDEIGTLVLVFRRSGEDWLIVAESYSYASAHT